VKQFLVEVFAPRARAADLASAERRARDAAERVSAADTAVRYVRATYVPEDETCFYVFEAASADLVARASALAELGEGRIVEARTTEGRGR
jgi:hypothetical protein